MKTLARGLVLLVFVFLGLPCLSLGILGLQDRLMDATEGQNYSVGWTFLVIFAMTLGVTVIVFVLTRRPKS